MQLTFVDNAGKRLVDVLAEAISTALRVKLAVAFAKMSGFRLLERAFHDCTRRGGHIEFLFGLDFRTTEPAVLRNILEWRARCNRVALYCFSDPATDRTQTYHPKLYVVQAPSATTTVVGSSNLTAGGLAENVEADVVIDADEDELVVAEVLDMYHRLKLQPSRFAPDAGYVAAYADAYQKARRAEHTAMRKATVRACIAATRRRERLLPKPVVMPADFVGWQRLVLERLPEGEFSTSDMYQYADDFRRHYPENKNVEAKIRQILQQLRDLGVISHVRPGRWRGIRLGES